FYVFDYRSFSRMPRQLQSEASYRAETWRFEGAVNVVLLFVIVGAVFAPDRFFIRQALMVGTGIASWFFTSRTVHEENPFRFGPIKEVALLFAGIFLTMLPALDFLAQHAQAFGFTHALDYYFASGALSSILDNAPTYANFFELARSTAVAVATDPGAPPGV